MSVRESVHNLVVSPVRSRPFFAMSSALVMVAGMLFGANIANADSVWVQSYERTSQTQACVGQPGETPWQASWGTNSSWSPSWEQWANKGKGGWVCTRSITWARDSTSSTVTYNVGDIGPGGGLVFYIDSGSGLRYEMAPKTWRGSSSDDTPKLKWCDTDTGVPLAVGIAVGTGAANTAAMADPTKGCASSPAATAALAYPGTNGSAGQWFIPSVDELNAMCYYASHLAASPDPTVACYVDGDPTQDPTFAVGPYGFNSYFRDKNYWSSSQYDSYDAYYQVLYNGTTDYWVKNSPELIRPIRAF